jgi:hypothetical protein
MVLTGRAIRPLPRTPSNDEGRSMKRSTLVLVALVLLMPGGVGQASAAFIDSFNSENGGAGILNYNNFANWTVANAATQGGDG